MINTVEMLAILMEIAENQPISSTNLQMLMNIRASVIRECIDCLESANLISMTGDGWSTPATNRTDAIRRFNQWQEYGGTSEQPEIGLETISKRVEVANALAMAEITTGSNLAASIPGLSEKRGQYQEWLHNILRPHFIDCLRATGGHISSAAMRLGCPDRTFRHWMGKLDIGAADFR